MGDTETAEQSQTQVLGSSGLTSRQQRRVRTRQRLLESGLSLFIDRGIANTTIADITDKAGVAAGTFYVHFKDKEALLSEALLEATEMFAREMKPIYTSSGADGLTARVRDHICRWVEAVEREPKLSRFVYGAELANTSVGRTLFEYWSGHVEQQLRAGMAERMAEHSVREDIDPVVAARAIMGMIAAVLSWWSADVRQAPREVVIDTLAAVWLTSLTDETA